MHEMNKIIVDRSRRGPRTAPLLRGMGGGALGCAEQSFEQASIGQAFV